MRVSRDGGQLTPEMREKLTLNIVYLIADSYLNGKKLWHVDALAKRLAVTSNIIDELLDVLEQHKYIVRKDTVNGELFPYRPLEKILISDLIFCVRGEIKNNEKRLVSFDKAIDEVFDTTNQVLRDTLSEKTIKDLLVSTR